LIQAWNYFQKRVQISAIMCGLCFALVIQSGCGKKAPPVAPRQIPLVAVADLQGVLSAKTVRLAWHHAAQNESAAGYIVLRAQAALSRPACPDCPLVFQKVDTIPMDRSARKQRQNLAFQQEIAAGFRYTYNVRPYQSSGAQGPDSNLVVIEFPIPTESRP